MKVLALLLTLGLALFALPPASAGEDGLVTRPSRHSFSDTLAKLEAAIAASGDFKVLFKLDHAKAAAAAGNPIKPMHLVLFGNPKSGSVLQAAAPTIGLDLPMRALVWEDPAGKVFVTVNAAAWLLHRHGLGERAEAISQLDAQLGGFVRAATE